MSEDVVIAGGGPNGLMLACELALAGVRPLVLERLTEPTTEQRANGLVGQVVRMLDRRGLYARIASKGGSPRPMDRYMFGALPLDLADVADNPLYSMLVPQRRVEQMLAERAAELGVTVRRGAEVTGCTQAPDEVTVEVNGQETVTARYVVGADGGRSVVRHLAGIDFPGVTDDRTISRTGHVSVPAEFRDKSSGGLNVPGFGIVPPFMHTRTETGVISYAAFPDGRVMVSVSERRSDDDTTDDDTTDDGELSLDELRAAVRRVLGADVPLGPPAGPGPHLARRSVGRNTRIAERFRDGRVLLVGDAAHVHSAIGGPGLNLGLQDAVNLGWKLAAQVRGWAPAGLLDSYETERRPAAERVVMQTQAQSVLIGPGPEVTALRQLFGELLGDAATRARVAALVAGGDLRYDMGPGARDDAAAGLVGRWAPDLTLKTKQGKVRLTELTRDARPLLLDLTDSGAYAQATAPWGDRVRAVTGSVTDGPADLAAVLLRPDCYVAWATGVRRPGGRDAKALRAALAHWFGDPPR